jgi:penicillin amidase
MKKILLSLLTALFFFVLGVALFFTLSLRSSRPDLKGVRKLAGVRDEVILVTDTWGVPHIYAQNEEDLFFACGYVQARDRLFQMDLVRRFAWGRLSEIFGPGMLRRDKVMRTLGLGEAAAKDLSLLHPSAGKLLRQYCRGVNAWMQGRRMNWPPEFLALRFQPEPWRPEDVLIINDLMALAWPPDFAAELLRMNLFKKLGDVKAAELLEPGLQGRPPLLLEAVLEGREYAVPQQGSAWVVSGARTKSGLPILASDSQMAAGLPSLWYEMHLDCPGLHAAGVTFPGIPLILAGHNDSLAWGLTGSGLDAQDLFIEELDGGRSKYRGPDGWETVKKKRVLIKVRGRRRPLPWIVEWTERGPILSPLIIKSEKPLSLRWALHDGSRSFEAFLGMNKARTTEEFRAALALGILSSSHVVFADREGNIGGSPGGGIPLRKAESGAFPYPAWDAEGAWKGYLPEGETFGAADPAEGMVVAAGCPLVPAEFPHYAGIGLGRSIRAERIRELLSQTESHTLDSFKLIQGDVFSKMGEGLMQAVPEGIESDPAYGDAIRMLKGWDLQMGEGSAPALYGVFQSILYGEIFLDELGADFPDFEEWFLGRSRGLQSVLMDPESTWFDNTATPERETRRDILLSSLARAYGWLSSRWGADPAAWSWPEINTLSFRHPLGGRRLTRFLNRGPFPMKGDPFTILVSRPMPDQGRAYSAGYRQILDLGDWKNCISVIPTGQSGHFRSPHYDDQIPLWVDGRYHPMLFYSEDVETYAEGKLFLIPSSGKTTSGIRLEEGHDQDRK